MIHGISRRVQRNADHPDTTGQVYATAQPTVAVTWSGTAGGPRIHVGHVACELRLGDLPLLDAEEASGI